MIGQATLLAAFVVGVFSQEADLAPAGELDLADSQESAEDGFSITADEEEDGFTADEEEDGFSVKRYNKDRARNLRRHRLAKRRCMALYRKTKRQRVYFRCIRKAHIFKKTRDRRALSRWRGRYRMAKSALKRCRFNYYLNKRKVGLVRATRIMRHCRRKAIHHYRNGFSAEAEGDEGFSADEIEEGFSASEDFDSEE